MIREYLGIEAAYKGYPISITKDGDIIVSCGSTSAALNFLKTLPRLKIEPKIYTCDNCKEKFTDHVKYEIDESDCENSYVVCPNCHKKQYLDSYCWYR